MNENIVKLFLNGDIAALTLDETLKLKDVITTTRRGETAVFTDNKIAVWLLQRGAKFKDFGFKYEIENIKSIQET